jgi:biofilm PGA synthesis N-glycosyltransferase PgaC
MKISLLVPCYNEEKSIEASIQSCLKQSRPFDQIIFVDDCSTDKTSEILEKYSKKYPEVFLTKKTPKNSGNKSSAQEFGLQFIEGDIMVTTDGDTLMDENFVYEIEKSFVDDPRVVAVSGYVKSLPYNWLTLCRAFDYAVGQNIHKLAQNYMNFIFVMPGAASAFKTNIFKKHITFDHDTICEDLDFTYRMHKKYFKIIYNEKAIVYTQDPTTLGDYINQMRRWFGGGWQNLLKHHSIISTTPIRAFELSLMYSEGIVFSFLIFLLPLINLYFELGLLLGYFMVGLIFATWAAIKEKRQSLVFAPFPYMVLMFINSYIYLEQFVKEVVLKRKNLVWFKPGRVNIKLIQQ